MKLFSVAVSASSPGMRHTSSCWCRANNLQEAWGWGSTFALEHFPVEQGYFSHQASQPLEIPWETIEEIYEINVGLREA